MYMFSEKQATAYIEFLSTFLYICVCIYVQRDISVTWLQNIEFIQKKLIMPCIWTCKLFAHMHVYIHMAVGRKPLMKDMYGSA